MTAITSQSRLRVFFYAQLRAWRDLLGPAKPLGDQLRAARQRTQLRAPPERTHPSQLCRCFQGQLVDRRGRYRQEEAEAQGVQAQVQLPAVRRERVGQARAARALRRLRCVARERRGERRRRRRYRAPGGVSDVRRPWDASEPRHRPRTRGTHARPSAGCSLRRTRMPRARVHHRTRSRRRPGALTRSGHPERRKPAR